MKKLYIWLRVDECSDNYHSEGGVIAIANSEKEAREKANRYIVEHSWDKNRIKGIREDEKPDYALDVITDPVFEAITFPDAGCC